METFVKILNWQFLTKIWIEGNIKWIFELVGISLSLVGIIVLILFLKHRKKISVFLYFLLFFWFFAFFFEINFGGLKKGLFLKPIYHLPLNEKVIALTFDDGPNPKYTPKILNILAHYQVKATFFVLGKNVKQYPNIVLSIAAEGHDIGNHSYSHPYMGRMGPSAIEEELDKVEDEIKHLGLSKPFLFRPPHGSKSIILEWCLRKRGYRLITWDLSPKDWKLIKTDILLSRLLTFVQPGSIILLHDGPNAVRILSDFIEIMRKRGYRFIKISDAL